MKNVDSVSRWSLLIKSAYTVNGISYNPADVVHDSTVLDQ